MFPIDFVITWVDQNDQKWLEKYASVAGTQDPNGDEQARYRDYGTLKFLFRSIEVYAPWVNHVFLVTDEQVPAWLKTENEKVTVIDHKQIIPARYLPTFNSNVIDFHLVNIPGLAEHFVYFNDDMFLNRAVEPTDFFDSEGHPRDFLSFNAIMPNNVFEHTYVNNLAILNNAFSKKKTLAEQFFKIFNPKNGKWNLINLCLLPFPMFTRFVDPHTPVSYCQSRIRGGLAQFPEMLASTCPNQTRATSDFSLWFFRYFDLLSGYYSHRRADFGKAYQLQNWTDAVRDILKSKHRVLNINDSDKMSDHEYEEATAGLRQAFSIELGSKSSFEK
ncbi:stealth family protein [Lacticaseibacillus absianus]|uniref:stealth family protein n=1 Tax=Lacticaseibacillus absianus TaxID=2729623 RepID=UPI0015CDE6AC|nr:stealth family protein [Lacticaseibacillus absianus]